MAILNLRTPNGYDGQPATKFKMGIVRLATDVEALAGTSTQVAVTPAQMQASTSADFASPPVLGFGSTTPRPVHATTLDSTGLTSVSTGAGAVLNLGNATGTIGFFGTTAAAKPAATADIKDGLALMGLITNGGATPLNLDGGALTAGAISGTSVTASTGNLVASTSGAGILLTSDQASGVAASPVVVNGRSGRATFTASTTEVMLCMSGASTGSALSIKSKTASSGSLAIVITNGTGASTTLADIQIDFLILNA